MLPVCSPARVYTLVQQSSDICCHWQPFCYRLCCRVRTFVRYDSSGFVKIQRLCSKAAASSSQHRYSCTPNDQLDLEGCLAAPGQFCLLTPTPMQRPPVPSRRSGLRPGRGSGPAGRRGWAGSRSRRLLRSRCCRRRASCRTTTRPPCTCRVYTARLPLYFGPTSTARAMARVCTVIDADTQQMSLKTRRVIRRHGTHIYVLGSHPHHDHPTSRASAPDTVATAHDLNASPRLLPLRHLVVDHVLGHLITVWQH